MKLLKYFLFISILITCLYFLVELNNMNSLIKVKIPFLIDNENFKDGFDVWITMLGTLSVGVVVRFLLALFQIISHKSDLIKTRSKLKKMQIALDSLRNQAIDDAIEITDEIDSVDEIDEFDELGMK